MGEWRELTTAYSLIHKVFNSLFTSILRLDFVHRRVNYLTVNALELSVGVQVNFNVVRLRQKFANQLEQAQKCLVVSGLFHVDVFGHN